jgi:hypothetical protein
MVYVHNVDNAVAKDRIDTSLLEENTAMAQEHAGTPASEKDANTSIPEIHVPHPYATGYWSC